MTHARDAEGHVHVHGAGGHSHGVVDPSLFATERGVWAIKWSLAGLSMTGLAQVVVYYFSGSVALLADTIHNFSDAATALPLWLAFSMSGLEPTKRYTYGYGRVEDLAGMLIVAAVLASAAVAGWSAVDRLFHPQPMHGVGFVAAASIIGFIGNEAIAILRIRVGREIGSAALVADGYHARSDGLTSLAVLAGAVGTWLGYPIADPVAGLVITAALLKIVWDSGRAVLTRVLDGVDPEVTEEIDRVTRECPGVAGVGRVRVRWLGHRMHAEVNVAVDPGLTMVQGHYVATEVEHHLLHYLKYLSRATVHVEPVASAGEDYHEACGHFE